MKQNKFHGPIKIPMFLIFAFYVNFNSTLFNEITMWSNNFQKYIEMVFQLRKTFTPSNVFKIFSRTAYVWHLNDILMTFKIWKLTREKQNKKFCIYYHK